MPDTNILVDQHHMPSIANAIARICDYRLAPGPVGGPCDVDPTLVRDLNTIRTLAMTLATWHDHHERGISAAQSVADLAATLRTSVHGLRVDPQLSANPSSADAVGALFNETEEWDRPQPGMNNPEIVIELHPVAQHLGIYGAYHTEPFEIISLWDENDGPYHRGPDLPASELLPGDHKALFGVGDPTRTFRARRNDACTWVVRVGCAPHGVLRARIRLDADFAEVEPAKTEIGCKTDSTPDPRGVLVTMSDIVGHVARYAVVQAHPGWPYRLGQVLQQLRSAAWNTGWDFPGSECPMHWFKSVRELEDWIRGVLWGSSQFMSWNEREFIGHDNFIDLDALLRNVAMAAFRDGQLEAGHTGAFDAVVKATQHGLPPIDELRRMAVAGALYDFVGHLTTLKEPMSVGAAHPAPPINDELVRFAASRGLSLDGADVVGWNAAFTAARPSMTNDEWRHAESGSIPYEDPNEVQSAPVTAQVVHGVISQELNATVQVAPDKVVDLTVALRGAPANLLDLMFTAEGSTYSFVIGAGGDEGVLSVRRDGKLIHLQDGVRVMLKGDPAAQNAA